MSQILYRVVGFTGNVLYESYSKDNAKAWIREARVGEPFLRYYRIDIKVVGDDPDTILDRGTQAEVSS